ncbi:hypothetical protein QLQ12_22565 [Actinoplanes sp. NEAU-A12]|uniref:Uncharacterized protein n=1 Tax=Actinoplanes sandaracinus TaxID=3045177 RepID=A0ABT6WNV0_9ACTN|nr:hypothetical protein [Actinoplanes sandaracinus]MDI6101404.1 hypothetical protein [Actinoplanes sandaracinus]
MSESRKVAATLIAGATLGLGILMSPSGAQAAPAGAGAAAVTCPATVAQFVVIASPRAVAKYLDSTLVRTSVVSGKLQCHFIGTSYAAVPGRPPVTTPNVAWSRPASVF